MHATDVKEQKSGTVETEVLLHHRHVRSDNQNWKMDSANEQMHHHQVNNQNSGTSKLRLVMKHGYQEQKYQKAATDAGGHSKAEPSVEG
jgi:hypothetical protein